MTQQVTHTYTQQKAQVSAFIKKLRSLDNSKSDREKFLDFCEMAYCALAKLTAPTNQRADELEARYMQIVGTYPDKDTVRAYPELLSMAWQGIELGWDFLGLVSGELNALNAEQGQFFTPMEVSTMMARMLLPDVGETIQRQGYVTIGEPAAGAGGMVIAAANVIQHEHGYDPSRHMLVHAVDVSLHAYHMCYVQLSLRGVAAYVERGNSISLEHFTGAWTPSALMFHMQHGHLSFDEARKRPRAADTAAQIVEAARAITDDAEPVVEVEPLPERPTFEEEPDVQLVQMELF